MYAGTRKARSDSRRYADSVMMSATSNARSVVGFNGLRPEYVALLANLKTNLNEMPVGCERSLSSCFAFFSDEDLRSDKQEV
jgi:hypothetical protein